MTDHLEGLAIMAGGGRLLKGPTLARIAKLEAENRAYREALEAAEKVLLMFREEGAELLAEGVHTGLRKGTDASDAMTLHAAIRASRSSAWGDAVEWALDPFFSMWGGDDALKKITTALTQGAAHPEQQGAAS